MGRKGLILIMAGFLVISFSALSFAGEEQSNQQPVVETDGLASSNSVVTSDVGATSAKTESLVIAKSTQPEWLYGEVNSVDIANKSIVLSYFDYDSDIEKQATVYSGDKTIFENVKSFEDIKPQDMVSIDYVVGPDSQNLAVSISVEKLKNIEDLNLELQVPAAIESEMKPAVETSAAPVQESPVSSDSVPESVKAQ